LAGAARAAGRTAAAAAAGSQLFSLSDEGVMSLASVGLGDSLAVTAAEASQLQGMLYILEFIWMHHPRYIVRSKGIVRRTCAARPSALFCLHTACVCGHMQSRHPATAIDTFPLCCCSFVARPAAAVVAASQAASQQAPDPSTPAAAAAGDNTPQQTAAAAASLWPDTLALAIQGSANAADVAVLRQQLAGFGIVQLSPEEVVGLTAGARPGLSVEDAYDAHPVMLPLVLLIEKAMELPSDVPVGEGKGINHTTYCSSSSTTHTHLYYMIQVAAALIQQSPAQSC
jgi:hypothetical protein